MLGRVKDEGYAVCKFPQHRCGCLARAIQRSVAALERATRIPINGEI